MNARPESTAIVRTGMKTLARAACGWFTQMEAQNEGEKHRQTGTRHGTPPAI